MVVVDGEWKCEAHAAAQARFLKMMLLKQQRALRVFIDSDIHRPLNGLSRGGRLPPWRGARKLHINIRGPFPLLNGPFSDLNGPFPRISQWAIFPLEKPLETAHSEKAH